MSLPPYRSSYSVDRLDGTGDVRDYIFTGRDMNQRPPGSRTPLVILPQHQTGAGAIAWAWDTNSLDQVYQHSIQKLTQDYVVALSDFGLTNGIMNTHWGNSQSVQELAQYRVWLRDNLGTSEKIGLIGVSHGGLHALNFARSLSDFVAFVAVIMPAMSLANLKSRQAELGLNVDAAYGGNYTDASWGEWHSPHYYRASYQSSKVPTGIWTSSNDSVVLNTYADDFVAANPTVERFNLGAYDHEVEGVMAALPKVVEWVRQFADAPYVPPAETLGPNLISNPTFDTNLTGWTNIYGTLSRDTTEKRSGAASLKHLSLTVSGYGFYSGYMSTTPGQKYRFRAWVKGSGAIQFRMTYASTDYFTSQNFTLTGSWQEVSFDYTPSAGQTAMFVKPIWATANSTLYMDDVYFGTVT